MTAVKEKSNELLVRCNRDFVVDHNHDGVNRRGFLKCMAWAPGRCA